MRILILHSQYLSGWASGENSVVRDEARLLAEAGHDVLTWTPTPGPDTSPSRLGLRAVWSAAALANVRRLIGTHRPQIVHCHNLFPMLSPAVLRSGTKSTARIVVTLHNYRMLCLPATCIRQGEICELCVGRIPWRGVAYRCYRGSLLGSAALAASLTVHRSIRSLNHVALFVPVSRFVRDKHVEAGFASNRMVVKPNFSWPRPLRRGVGEYFLYAGRLAPEKDLPTLLGVWTKMQVPLIVAGDGPDTDALRAMAPPGVTFTGAVGPDEVSRLLEGARALLLPTLCNEGGPRSVVEAYAAGVPVVATGLGALPEMIDHGVSGLLVAPRSADEWSDALESLTDDANVRRMGEGALDLWRREYSPEPGLQRLERIYEAALTAA